MKNRSNDSHYQWDYQDYRGNYGQNPAPRKRNAGLKYFLIAMGVVIVLAGALCIGVTAWNGKAPAPNPPGATLPGKTASWSICPK